MIGPAIGEIVVKGRSRGTAFAVTDVLHLTCWHCVADPTDATRLATEDIEIRYAPGLKLDARVLSWDLELDVALLGTISERPLPDGWTPLRLGRSQDGLRGAPVDVVGWPLDNPSTTTSRCLPCRIEDEIARIGAGVEALALYSDQVAAGRGARPRGFSGSPVLLRTPAGPAVIGVLRWMQEDEDDPERAVGGVVYATRVASITTRWPNLRAAPEPVADLAGDVAAPLRDEIEAFLGTQLRGPGGELPFAGRTAELTKLTEWLDDPGAAGHHVVSGPAGIGKSTLLTRWAIATAARVGTEVVILPISVRFATNGEHDAVVALAHRLSRTHAEVIERTISTAEASAAVRALLARPAPPGASVVVVVDAIDEADGWTPAASGGLGLLPPQLGAGVRLLVSARHTGVRPSATAWAQHLGVPDAAATTLEPLGPAAMGELLAHVWPGEDPSSLAAAAARLWELTAGEPVTVALHLADIRLHDTLGPAAWTARTHTTAPGLDGFFEQWWRDQERLWAREPAGRRDDAERVLRILTTAEGPLRLRELRALARRLLEPLDAVRIDQAVHALDRFVVPGPASDSVVVAHPAITQMLRDRLRRSEALDEYQAIFSAWGAEVLGRLRTENSASAEVPAYLFRHLATHLTSGDRFLPAAMELTAPAWRRARDAASDTVDGFRTDVRRVAEHARRLDEQRHQRGEAPRLLPERIMCAAELASDRSALTGGMSAGIAAEFVRHRLWRPGRALSYVAEHTRPGIATGRADAVAAICPVIPADQLEALDQLVGSALLKAWPEEQAAVAAAWASRLLDLGHFAEARSVAERLSDGNKWRDFVNVWVLAELLPRLPDELAGPALAAALTEAFTTRQDYIDYAICRLTQLVSLRHAERIWPYVDEDALPWELRSLASQLPRWWGEVRPRAMLVAALERKLHHVPFLRFGFHRKLSAQSFVAAARWLPDDVRSATIRAVMQTPDIGGVEDEAYPDLLDHHRRRALSPALFYDGLLSVLPAADAADAVDWVEELLGDPSSLSAGNRLCCLAQIVPQLPEQLRSGIVEKVLDAAPNDLASLASDYHLVSLAVPAIVSAGATDRLLDVVRRPSSDLGRIVVILAPLLSEKQTVDLLNQNPRSMGKAGVKALRARLASFGPRQAGRVLNSFYADALPPLLIQMLRGGLDGGPDIEEFAVVPQLPAWWRDANYGTDPKGGEPSYQFWPGEREEDELGYALKSIDAESFSVSLVVDLAAGMTERFVPQLISRARALPDHWQRLVLLAAGTHLQPGPTAETVRQEIKAAIDELRDAPGREPGSYWAPDDGPWLARRFNGWTPFFARLLAPPARPEIAESLFVGDYLDGVVEERNRDEKFDRWAVDVLALTPLLDAEQLSHLALRQGLIHGGTTRAYFHAGLAVGYAACGCPAEAYRMLDDVGGPDPDKLKSHVLAEILHFTGDDELPDWMTTVHQTFRDAAARGVLWNHVLPRLPGLSDEQLWAVLDQWLARTYSDGRLGVLADVLMYRHPLARLVGRGECTRLLELIERRGETGFHG